MQVPLVGFLDVLFRIEWFLIRAVPQIMKTMTAKISVSLIYPFLMCGLFLYNLICIMILSEFARGYITDKGHCFGRLIRIFIFASD
jgi:uncharacterized membrane protein